MTLKQEKLVAELLKDMPFYEWKRLATVITREYENRASKVTLADSASLENELKQEFNLL